jgi:hypothetical protein
MDLHAIGGAIMNFNRTLRKVLALQDSGKHAEVPKKLKRCVECLDILAAELAKAPPGLPLENLPHALHGMRRDLARAMSTTAANAGPTIR